MTSPLFGDEEDEAVVAEGGTVGAYPAVRPSTDPVEPSRAILLARDAGRKLWAEVQRRLVQRG